MRRGWLALIVVAALVACGGSGSSGGQDTGSGPQGDVMADTNARDSQGGPDVVAGGLVLELFGMPSPTQAVTDAALRVQARVYDPETASPVRGVAVTFALSVETPPQTGSPDASLEEAMALTGEGGIAETILRTGTVSGAVYRVDITATGADNSVSLIVQVGEQPKGDLRVTFGYEGDNAPVDLRVMLLNQVFVCDGFNPGAPPQSPLAEYAVPFAAGEWLGQELTQSGLWVVLLIGLDASGSIVASGCRAELRVVPNTTSEATITMYPVGLHLPGTYDFTETLDLSAGAPADFDEFRQALETGLATPSAALTAMAESIYEEIYREPQPPPADANDVAEPPTPCHELWEADYPGAIAAHDLDSPGWLDQLSGFETKVATALSAVRLDGAVQIAGAPPGPYTGSFTWEQMSLTYDGQAISLSLEEWQSLIYVLRLATEEAVFEADVEGYDRLVVNEHSLKIEPGRLAGYLLLYHALGDVGTEVATVQDLVKAHFDCRGLVRRLAPEVTTCLARFQFSNEGLAERCEEVAMELIDDAITILESWISVTEGVALSGEATVVDEDQDLAVDHSRDGALSGQLLRNGNPVGEVTSAFGID